MKIKLTEYQQDRVTLATLGQMQWEVSQELECREDEGTLHTDDGHDSLRLVVALETVIEYLMAPEAFEIFKLDQGYQL